MLWNFGSNSRGTQFPFVQLFFAIIQLNGTTFPSQIDTATTKRSFQVNKLPSTCYVYRWLCVRLHQISLDYGTANWIFLVSTLTVGLNTYLTPCCYKIPRVSSADKRFLPLCTRETIITCHFINSTSEKCLAFLSFFPRINFKKEVSNRTIIIWYKISVRFWFDDTNFKGQCTSFTGNLTPKKIPFHCLLRLQRTSKRIVRPFGKP